MRRDPSRTDPTARQHQGFLTNVTQALLTLLCCLGILVSGMTPVRAQDWEVVNVEGRDYVTLRSFCGFLRVRLFPGLQQCGILGPQ